MATEGILQCSPVEDSLQQHGKSLSDTDLASRKAEEDSLRRSEAAGWLRKMVGVVAARDLPAEPSEEGFRLGLRSGIILCNVLNKVQPGAVPKVVELPSDFVIVPDGAALSAYQYFENVRNFLVAVEEIGLPTFEASDLEKGGNSSRVINCVLALKSYNDGKLGGGNLKSSSSLKNGELSSSNSEKSLNSLLSDQSATDDFVHGDRMVIHELLLDKKREDIPIIVENMVRKLMEEFEDRLASEKEQMKTTCNDMAVSESEKSPIEVAPEQINMDNETTSRKVEEEHQTSAEVEGEHQTSTEVEEEHQTPRDIEEEHQTSREVEAEEHHIEEGVQEKQSKAQILRKQMLVEQHQREIHELKSIFHAAKTDMQFLQEKCQEGVSNLRKHLQTLVHAASGYQKVLEENRKLYNQVQDLKGNIRVYCRVRPFLPGQPTGVSTVDHIDERNIKITTPSKYGKDGRKTFTFNKIFGPSATQEEVFADTRPLIRSVLDGYNVCIFAYGQTGSGKTHTMMGPNDLTKESMGVNYRALSDLFLISGQRKDIISYDISVQMIEIYNEQVRDLLDTDGLNKRLEIRNSSQKGINVPDANILPVTSTSDVINLMNLGQKNRAVSATAMNDRSSRSHSCLTVHVQGRYLTSGKVLRGCMHLVDLAGSERADKTEAAGDRLKEAQHINKSLSALGDVIASLAQKNSHVPYRNSKLTLLLQDSLGGQAKTLMFVHISPEPDAVGETISTLKFAERVSTVELGAARSNKESSEIRELKEQIATLKAAFARKDGEPGHFQHSKSSSPERFRGKSSRSTSPSSASWRSLDMEDVESTKGGSNSTAKTKRRSLDPQDFLMNSPPWSKDDEKDAASGEWVDKVIANKGDGVNRDKSQGRLEEDSRRLPSSFYQKHTPDHSKVHPEQPLNKVLDDPDDLDAATSDSSEADFVWHTKIPKARSVPSGLGSKSRKPSPKPGKSPEPRSSIPTPSRRPSNGITSPLHKTKKQPVSGDGKRRPGSGSGK